MLVRIAFTERIGLRLARLASAVIRVVFGESWPSAEKGVFENETL